jgi:hypothetical protein
MAFIQGIREDNMGSQMLGNNLLVKSAERMRNEDGEDNEKRRY